MSDDSLITPRLRRFTRETRPDITLPNGKKLTLSARFAEKNVGVSDRSIRRLNPPTVYVGNCAYIDPEVVLQLIADGLQRRHQPRNRTKSPPKRHPRTDITAA